MVLGDLGADVIRIDRPADAGKASDYPILHRNGRVGRSRSEEPGRRRGDPAIGSDSRL